MGKYRKILRWASLITTEDVEKLQKIVGIQNEDNPDFEENKIICETDYYWTLETDKIYELISLGLPGLVGVVGLQGIGKSALMYALQSKIFKEDTKKPVKDKRKIFLFKLKEMRTETLFDLIQCQYADDIDIPLWYILGQAVYQKLGNIDWAEFTQKKIYSTREGENVNKDNIENIIFATDKELTTGKKKNLLHERSAEFLQNVFRKELGELATKRILHNVFVSNCSSAWVTLIDFPDYNKKDVSSFSRDLNKILSLWDSPHTSKGAKIVVFLQQELIENTEHFALGKMEKIYLKPLPSNALVDIYLKKWGSLQPFTEGALKEVAEISRGIFRRFLKYIAKVLYEVRDSGKQITLEMVKEIIDIEVVAQDMDSELLNLYPKFKENRLKVVKIIEYLRERNGVLQKEIVNVFFEGSNMSASRVLTRLENDYITIARKGKNNIINLKRG